MARKKPANGGSIYRLNVTLLETDPPIWRQMLVRGDTTLDDLHLVLQAAMGWFNCHLHSFTIGYFRFGWVDPDFEDDMQDERGVVLEQVVERVGAGFGYMYDFGDGWDHHVRVEAIEPAKPKARYPQCLDGARACPPEDVGGIWGYEEFLEAIADPDHEQHEDMLTWCGGSFDPEAFDLAKIDKAVQHYELMAGEEP